MSRPARSASARRPGDRDAEAGRSSSGVPAADPAGWVPPAWALVVVAVVGVAVTAVVLADGFLVGVDHAVSHVFRTWGVRDDPWPLRLTYLLTLPGQRGTVLVVSVPLFAWLVWRGRSVDPAVRYLAALVTLTAAVYAIKWATARTAPPVDGFHTATGASFPSGHVANAVLVWGVAAFCAGRVVGVPPWLRRTTRRVALVAPIAVTVGMTVLDYHWLTDFVVGACLGVLLLRVVELDGWARVSARLDRRLVRPSAAA